MARGGTRFVGSGPAVSRAGGSGPRFVGFGGPSVPQVITRVTPAVIGPYVAGDLPTDAYAPGTYFSTAGDIASVGAAWTVNGEAWDEVTALAEGDEVRLTETVEDDDSPPNSRVFPYGPVVVAEAPEDVLSNLMIDPDTGAVTLDTTEAGTLYWHVQEASEPAPSNADIIAGTGADVSGSEVVDAGTTNEDIDISGLSAGVEYTIRFLLVYGADQESNVAAATFERAAASVQWTLSGALYTGPSESLTGSDMRAVDFSADGSRMYAVFRGTEVVRQYDLDPAYDVTSASAAGDGSHDFSGYITTGTRGDSVAHGFFTRKDTGTTAWLVNRTEVFELTLATPWDITTASQTGYIFLGTGNSTGHVLQRAHDLDWRPDGTQWFIDDRNAGRVFRFAVTTPWDITTSVAAGSYVIPNVDEVRGIELQRDGARMFLMHTTAQEAREYALSTPWDVSTASVTTSLDVSGQSSNPRSIVFRPDGVFFYIGDASSRRVHVYDILGPNPPGAFADVDWSVSSTGELTIAALPEDNRAAISDIEYRIDGGSPVSLGENAPGAYATAAEPDDEIEIRAVNSAGAGPWSSVKVVPSVAGIVTFVGQTLRTTPNAPAGTNSMAVPSGVQTGDLLIFCTSVHETGTAAVEDVRDDAGNPLTKIGERSSGANNGAVIWAYIVPATVPDNILFTNADSVAKNAPHSIVVFRGTSGIIPRGDGAIAGGPPKDIPFNVVNAGGAALIVWSVNSGSGTLDAIPAGWASNPAVTASNLRGIAMWATGAVVGSGNATVDYSGTTNGVSAYVTVELEPE
jgi:hypothetical protein